VVSAHGVDRNHQRFGQVGAFVPRRPTAGFVRTIRGGWRSGN
jgi:hypothetical protein